MASRAIDRSSRVTAPGRRPPRLPREHGAWVMLAVPLVVGLSAVGVAPGRCWLVVPAVLLVFLARYAAVPVVARRIGGRRLEPGQLATRTAWAGVYLASSLAILAVAVELAPEGIRREVLLAMAGFLILGVLHTVLVLPGLGRNAVVELVGMAGLASSPAVIATLAGAPLDGRALAPASVCLAYFASTLSTVRLFRGGRLVSGVASHAAIVAGLLLARSAEWLGAAVLLAFVPVLGRFVLVLAYPPRDLRVLGRREMIVAIVFTSIAALALWRTAA